jgi:hypothetical protein
MPDFGMWMFGNASHESLRKALKGWRVMELSICTLQCFVLGITVNSLHVILYIVTPIGAWILQANHGIVGIFY